MHPKRAACPKQRQGAAAEQRLPRAHPLITRLWSACAAAAPRRRGTPSHRAARAHTTATRDTDAVALSLRQFTIFASFVSFALVFRTNLSIARYWEARTFVETMRNRLAEACLQIIHFDEGAAMPNAEYSEQEIVWRARVIHLFSLMHALACQHLRDDLALSNLRSVGEMVVAGGSASSPQQTGRIRRCLSNFGDLVIDGRAEAAPPDSVRVNPSVLLPAPPPHQEKSLGVLPLSQVFFPRGSKATAKFNQTVPLAVIGGVSEEERSALEATHARVRLVQSWILRAMAERMRDDGMLIGSTRFPPTPIISRTYQMISEGTLAFAQARKIVETPAPWPHVHLLELALLCFAFVMPLCMVAWMAELWSAVLLDAIVVFSFTTMNEVAIELEDPFLNQPHAIALATLQAHFNEELCCYAHEYALVAQPTADGASSGVGKLPPAAARAAAAAQRAQGGGPGLSVRWVGSTYAALRCYLLSSAAGAPSEAAPAQASAVISEPASPKLEIGGLRFFT